MTRTSGMGGALVVAVAVLAATATGKLLVAVPNPAASTGAFAADLGSLADGDAKAKDLAKRHLLRAGLVRIRRLQAVRDELSEMLGKYEDLKSDDRDKAVPAVRYFEKYGAAEFVAVALENSNPDVLLPALKSLSDLNTKSVLPQVLDALERNNFIQQGYEEASLHIGVVMRLLRLVNKLSGKDYKVGPFDTEGIAAMIKEARKQ
jgi:hypothetical protein